MCVILATLDRAIKNFEMTDPWPLKRNQVVLSMGRRRWNILPGTGCQGIVCEVGVTSEAGSLSRNRSHSRSKFCRFHIHTRDAEPKSEPEHFARDQNRSRQDILL